MHCTERTCTYTPRQIHCTHCGHTWTLGERYGRPMWITTRRGDGTHR